MSSQYEKRKLAQLNEKMANRKLRKTRQKLGYNRFLASIRFMYYLCFRNFGTFMCRLLPATTIGEAVYGDEMSDFECVTTQPGCRQVCYNQFSPMTHTRFWSMHILILSFPPILYSFIAANFNAKYTILQKRLTEEIESNDNRFETFTSAKKNSALSSYD